MITKYNKIFVIGSNSFSGSNFINQLLLKNKKIIGISRSNEYQSTLLPYKSNSNLNNFKFYKLDVNKDLNKIIKLLDKFKPDIVINFSAQGEVRNSWLKPEDWYRTNCLSVVNISNALINKRYLKKYISLSTPEVYGSSNKALVENNNYNPSTPYAASKLAGDLHLLTLYKKYRFPVVFSRSSNVYGPYQQLYRIIPRTIIYLKMNKKIILHGKGLTKRQFIHISDVVNGIVKIIERGNIGEIYHISPKSNKISIYQIVNLICKKMGENFQSSIKLTSENFGQDASYILNSSKIRKKLNWSEKENLNKGINETINWINDNWSKIIKLPHEYKHKK